jgi:hypothetical protein
MIITYSYHGFSPASLSYTVGANAPAYPKTCLSFGRRILKRKSRLENLKWMEL